jgi:hypothetical protein
LQGSKKAGTASTAKHRVASMVKHFVGFGSWVYSGRIWIVFVEPWLNISYYSRPEGGLNTAPVRILIRDLNFLPCVKVLLYSSENQHLFRLLVARGICVPCTFLPSSGPLLTEEHCPSWAHTSKSLELISFH